MCDVVTSFAPVAQLDRASDSGSEGWGFESLRAYQRKTLQSEWLQGFSLFSFDSICTRVIPIFEVKFEVKDRV